MLHSNKSEGKVNGRDRSLEHAHSHGPEVTEGKRRADLLCFALTARGLKKSGGL